MDARKLSQLYKYKPLLKYNGIPGKTKVISRRIRFGVEIEVEDIFSTFTPTGSSFQATADNSLKVNGVEFVSLPLELQFIEVELQRLKGGYKFQEHSFSRRTSIHTHMNSRDLTVEELHKFLILYLIFERGLFKYSGGRNNNPFCIPLYQLQDRVSNAFYELSLGNVGFSWNKYMALNLCPLWGNSSEGSKKYGTIEFRHMQGNLDIPYIIDWMNLQACLKIAAKKFELEDLLAHVRTMNTTSGYGWLIKQVFGNWSNLITSQPDCIQDMEDGIAFTKLCLPSVKVNKNYANIPSWLETIQVEF